jgi:hypothetical protein
VIGSARWRPVTGPFHFEPPGYVDVKPWDAKCDEDHNDRPRDPRVQPDGSGAGLFAQIRAERFAGAAAG